MDARTRGRMGHYDRADLDGAHLRRSRLSKVRRRARGRLGLFAKVSIPLPGLMAPFIAVLELVGGILLFLGVASRWLGLLFAIEMIVTTFWVQIPSQGWNASELDRILLAGGILLFFAGPGRAAVDELWLEKGA